MVAPYLLLADWTPVAPFWHSAALLLLPPYAGSVSKHQLSLLTVPYFDVEIRGVYGLKVCGTTYHPHALELSTTLST